MARLCCLQTKQKVILLIGLSVMVFRFLHCLDLGNYGVYLGKKFTITISVIACVLYFQYNFYFLFTVPIVRQYLRMYFKAIKVVGICCA